MKKISENLENIRKYIHAHQLSSFETENLNRDVIKTHVRLRAGFYKDSDSIARNTFDVERRTQEFFIYFKGYLWQADTWAKIFNATQLQKKSIVIDVCPGWSPKIELGLYKAKYRGSVIIFDQNKNIFQYLRDLLLLFPIQFSMKHVVRDLFTQNVPKGNIVVANHCIDDLLLDYYAKKNDLLLSDIYSSEAVFQFTVKSIIKDSAIQKEMVQILAERFSAMCLPKTLLFLTHYTSEIEKMMRLAKWTTICSKILKNVVKTLNNNGFDEVSNFYRKELTSIKHSYFKSSSLFVLKKR